MAKTKAKAQRKAGAPKSSGKQKLKKKPAGAKSVTAKAKQFRAAAAKRRSATAPAKKVVKKAVPKAAAPKAAKGASDRDKKAEALMARGRQSGFVTYDEILKQFPTIETDVEFLEELYDKFASAHIDVLEGGGMLEIEPDVPEKGYGRSDSQYDSIQMYLREIGKYPLLNAQEERDLAKRIVDGEAEARNL
jgi:hypothetical protein